MFWTFRWEVVLVRFENMRSIIKLTTLQVKRTVIFKNSPQPLHIYMPLSIRSHILAPTRGISTIVEFVHSRIIEILVAAVKLESKKYTTYSQAGEPQTDAGKRYCPDRSTRITHNFNHRYNHARPLYYALSSCLTAVARR